METDTDADQMCSKTARLDCFRFAIANMAKTKSDLDESTVEGLPGYVIALVQDIGKAFTKFGKKPVGFLDLPLELRRHLVSR